MAREAGQERGEVCPVPLAVSDQVGVQTLREGCSRGRRGHRCLPSCLLAPATPDLSTHFLGRKGR